MEVALTTRKNILAPVSAKWINPVLDHGPLQNSYIVPQVTDK